MKGRSIWRLIAAAVLLGGATGISARAEEATYTNPVLKNVPDPYVIRAGDDYFVYGTTDPDRGYRVHQSTDLVNWVDRGMALEKAESSWGRRHFWAPCVVEHDGRYLMFYSAHGVVDDDGREGHRICIAEADSPTGPFVDVRAPAFDVGKSVIDPDVFIDADGLAYLYFVLDKSENGRSEVYAVRLSGDRLSIRGDPVRCLTPSQSWEGGVWNEAPHVFRRGRTYVMMYSANGFFEPEYAVGYALASSPLGPWVKNRANPILSQRGEAVGTGHNCVAPSPDGTEWFCVYHAHGDGAGAQRRDLYIDRLVIEPDAGDGLTLRVAGPTRTPQAPPR